MDFIVVDDRGRLIAGACSSPDVAGLVALLEDEPAFVRSLEDETSRERTRASALPRGWSVVAGDDAGSDGGSLALLRRQDALKKGPRSLLASSTKHEERVTPMRLVSSHVDQTT
jgi:hypothetical protein